MWRDAPSAHHAHSHAPPGWCLAHLLARVHDLQAAQSQKTHAQRSVHHPRCYPRACVSPLRLCVCPCGPCLAMHLAMPHHPMHLKTTTLHAVTSMPRACVVHSPTRGPRTTCISLSGARQRLLAHRASSSTQVGQHLREHRCTACLPQCALPAWLVPKRGWQRFDSMQLMPYLRLESATNLQ